MTTLPTHADLPHRLWHELQQATTERGHAWRTPVLASLGLDGTPQARTVVLRGVDAAAQELRIYTDRRSPKVAELQQQPLVTLVFWSAPLQWQLRAVVRVAVRLDGPEVDAAWARVQHSAGAGDYLTPNAPGRVLDSADMPSAEAAQPHHLAVLVARVHCLDWLALARTGHQRARVEGSAVTWLVP